MKEMKTIGTTGKVQLKVSFNSAIEENFHFLKNFLHLTAVYIDCEGSENEGYECEALNHGKFQVLMLGIFSIFEKFPTSH